MAVLFPNDPAEEADALRAAALEPELFRELANYEGASDDSLVSRLVRVGFTQAGARAAVASYRETMAIVTGETTHYNPSHDEPNAVAVDRVEQPSTAMMTSPASPPNPSQRAYGFDVVLPGGARVDFRVTSGELTKDGIALLREYLNLIERSISAGEAEAATEASLRPSAASEPEQPAERSLIVRPE